MVEGDKGGGGLCSARCVGRCCLCVSPKVNLQALDGVTAHVLAQLARDVPMCSTAHACSGANKGGRKMCIRGLHKPEKGPPPTHLTSNRRRGSAPHMDARTSAATTRRGPAQWPGMIIRVVQGVVLSP